jgi:DNA-binding CsgD family transcriptional regulator
MSPTLDAPFAEQSPHDSPAMTLDIQANHGCETDRSGDEQVLSLLFDEISHGVLVVSPQGRVIRSNRAARDDMASSGVLYVQLGELLALSPIDTRLLLAALGKASQGARSLVKLSGSGVTMTLSAVPLQFKHGHTCQRIALFFERPAICDTGMFVFFARSHKLTRTEEQILTYLCRSMSTPDIAMELNVAVSTVRSHVRSVCFKTGAKGSRELINRIATLPPVGVMQQFRLH